MKPDRQFIRDSWKECFVRENLITAAIPGCERTVTYEKRYAMGLLVFIIIETFVLEFIPIMFMLWAALLLKVTSAWYSASKTTAAARKLVKKYKKMGDVLRDANIKQDVSPEDILQIDTRLNKLDALYKRWDPPKPQELVEKYEAQFEKAHELHRKKNK